MILLAEVPWLLAIAGAYHAAFSAAALVPQIGHQGRARAVATGYGVLVLAAVARELTSATPAGAAAGRRVFAAAAGYYLWALAHTVSVRGPASLSTLHHLCCFLCYSLSLDESLYAVLARSGYLFLLAELSTTCANLRWFAFRMRRLQWAQRFETAFVASFLVTRILVGIPLSVSWWMHDLPRIALPSVSLFYVAANLAWNLMNVWTAVRWSQRRQAPAPLASSSAPSTLGRTKPVLKIGSSCESACLDDEVSCHLDCHLDLWFLPVGGRAKVAEGEGGQAQALPDRAFDKAFLTRIHGKWYNLKDFKHPGGPIALSLIGARDGTALFESHHPFTSRDKLEQVLEKYRVRQAQEEPVASVLASVLDKHDDGAHYVWADGDSFEQELKAKVREYFVREAARRGVSVLEATKATPRRWLEIAVMFCVFACSVPALVRGQWWALFFSPVASWIWMVNYWHDACHFALSSNWVSASLHAPIPCALPTTRLNMS